LAEKAPAPPPQWLQKILRAGFKALNENRIKEASAHCRKLLSAKPDLVEGHFLVGLIALHMNDRKTAFNAFGSVTTLKKDHAAAWANMAKLCMSQGQVNRADKALEEAVTHESGDPLIQDMIGTIFSQMGEHSSAQAWFKKANKHHPGHPPFMTNLANSYIYFGDTEGAEKLLADLLAIQPNNPQAHWILSGSRSAKSEEHIDQLEKLALVEHAPPQALAFLNYARGKELEDLQQWDRAFDAFSMGASARRQEIEYDEASEADMFKALEDTYTKEWLDAQQSGHSDASPIFVVGQPRTGTTLVERIITSHSKVHSAGELRQFELSFRRLSNYQEPKRFSAELIKKAAHLDGEKLGATYIETTRKMRGNLPRFVDKLPTNYLYIPLILKALPNAKIVHLVRDPVDACFASFKQLFADAYPHSYEQTEMARHHARYRKLMMTWRERFPGQFFDISYEDTARNLEPNARELIDYLGLSWEDSCLNFHQQAGAVSTASAAQVREPAHTRSIGRWKRYEQQLSPMLEALVQEDIDIQ
jgi:Flp pilus assembly protein TadD